MLIVNVEGVVTRPESKPPEELVVAFAARYVHGLGNEDWVTECGILPPVK
jgi:hypothetical protein